MKNIYAGYIRKSSESKEKQALSIKSQREELQRTFPELNITEWIEEEKRKEKKVKEAPEKTEASKTKKTKKTKK